MRGIDSRITHLGWTSRQGALSHTIWDANAAIWASMVKPGSAENSLFATRDFQAEPPSSDLMTIWQWDELGQFIRTTLVTI